MESSPNACSDFERLPDDILTRILSSLGLKDLLSIESVCTFLSTAVRGDPLYWKTIHIDKPLNKRITDDDLVQLTGRAQGKLECLNLVECSKITDDGLRRVLEANRQLNKLCVPGCKGLSVEGIVSCIRAYNSASNEFGGIKRVRLGGIFFGRRCELFKELNSLLGCGEKKHQHHPPLFYLGGNRYIPYDDDRAIDIEMCPLCKKFELVYDCPYEYDGSNATDKFSHLIRACIFCVGRCAGCGCCMDVTELDIECVLFSHREFQCSDCYVGEFSSDGTRVAIPYVSSRTCVSIQRLMDDASTAGGGI